MEPSYDDTVPRLFNALDGEVNHIGLELKSCASLFVDATITQKKGRRKYALAINMRDKIITVPAEENFRSA